MADSRRHKQTPKDPNQPHVDNRARRSLVTCVVLTAVLAGAFLSVGKYFEFSYPDPYDSGGYVYSANHVLQGARIGVDTKPSAYPGTLLVNIIGVAIFGFSETGPKLMQLIFQAAALVLMFWAMYKLFGKLAASVGVIIAAAYLSAPLVAKFGNVKEQYMAACMVMGVSCFILRELNGKWPWALFAGAAVAWAPLFKPTGLSAIAAIGLFVLIQPIARRETLKKTITDILLLLTGAVIGLAPVYIWLAAEKAPVDYWPYSFAFKPIVKMAKQAPEKTPPKDVTAKSPDTPQKTTVKKQPDKMLWQKLMPAYVRQGWQMLAPEQRKEVVHRWLRFYRLLLLPIALALGAIIARLLRIIMKLAGKLPDQNRKEYERFVLLFAVWWLLDMAFVWVSPRSYEQYYLPLNASAAMLAGYLIALYSDALGASRLRKGRWLAVGIAGLVCMIVMFWPIVFGTKTSPHSGRTYKNPRTGQTERRKGYAQTWRNISLRRKRKLISPWEAAADYIKLHSDENDKIYVWGWYPGIYVRARRFSASAKPVMMPRPAPAVLERMIAELLTEFEHQPPKFIVDSRKRHIPIERPPYELWPATPKGFLPPYKRIIAQYDAAYSAMLRDRFGDDEADRYRALAPFRKFVRDNYNIVGLRDYRMTKGGEPVHRTFGQHVIFELKQSPLKDHPIQQ